MSLVNFDVEENLAIVTINRPEARNAVDRPTPPSSRARFAASMPMSH